MRIDKDKANAAIDDYIAKIQDPNGFPFHQSSAYVAKARLQKFGVIPDSRKLDLSDHCVLWPAVIAICGRVREVSRIEVAEHAVRKGQSLEKTIRRLKDPKARTGHGMLGRRFRQHLEDNQ